MLQYLKLDITSGVNSLKNLGSNYLRSLNVLTSLTINLLEFVVFFHCLILTLIQHPDLGFISILTLPRKNKTGFRPVY